MIETIGIIAGILFAVCGAPQAYQSWKAGNSNGISPWLLWMWWLGEVLMLVYVYATHGFDVPLMINYLGNLVFVTVILKYLHFPVDKPIK